MNVQEYTLKINEGGSMSFTMHIADVERLWYLQHVIAGAAKACFYAIENKSGREGEFENAGVNLIEMLQNSLLTTEQIDELLEIRNRNRIKKAS